MKKNKRILTSFFIVTICLLLISSCSPKQILVGKWQDQQSGATMEFFKDGTLSMTSYGMPITGSYTVLDAKNLKISMSGLLGIGGAQIYEYSVSGNTLTLNISGVSEQFTRVK